jgi:hypothetical protein
MNIIIYCNNSEQNLFRERASELIRSGLQYKFREIKYNCWEACDMVITLPRHEKTVRELFRGAPRTKIEVYDGSLKGTKVVAPLSAKEVSNGEESKKVGLEKGSSQAGQAASQGRKEGGSGEEKVIMPVTRNPTPKEQTT